MPDLPAAAIEAAARAVYDHDVSLGLLDVGVDLEGQPPEWAATDDEEWVGVQDSYRVDAEIALKAALGGPCLYPGTVEFDEHVCELVRLAAYEQCGVELSEESGPYELVANIYLAGGRDVEVRDA